jgi:hypothetical protein
VIQNRFNDMRKYSDVGKPRRNGSANIVQPPRLQKRLAFSAPHHLPHPVVERGFGVRPSLKWTCSRSENEVATLPQSLRTQNFDGRSRKRNFVR